MVLIYHNNFFGSLLCNLQIKKKKKKKKQMENKLIICIIVASISFIIFLPLYLVIVKKDQEYVDPWIQTMATYRHHLVQDKRCCDKVSCVCAECRTTITCVEAMTKLQDTIDCCEGIY